MSDRIDEFERNVEKRNVEPQIEWLCQRLNVQGTGYEGGPDDRALLEIRLAVIGLATIAREANARAWALERHIEAFGIACAVCGLASNHGMTCPAPEAARDAATD